MRKVSILPVLLFSACTGIPDVAPVTPEVAVPAVQGWPHGAMVSVANPYAAEAAAFMLVYDREDARLVAYDGRETAPRSATRGLFVRDGEPLGRLEAWQSGLSVGTPGIIALYELTHANHGRLP